MALPGQPLSAGIPEKPRAFALENQVSLRQKSVEMKKSPGYLTNQFRGKFAKAMPYIRLARYAGMTPEEFAQVITERRVSKLIEELKKPSGSRPKSDSVSALGRNAGVSADFITKLCNDDGELRFLKGCLETAVAFDCSVTDLLKPDENSSKSA